MVRETLPLLLAVLLSLSALWIVLELPPPYPPRAYMHTLGFLIHTTNRIVVNTFRESDDASVNYGWPTLNKAGFVNHHILHCGQSVFQGTGCNAILISKIPLVLDTVAATGTGVANSAQKIKGGSTHKYVFLAFTFPIKLIVYVPFHSIGC